jgi:hypothetical protein
MVLSEHARNRAEAAFKRKEDTRAEGLKAKRLTQNKPQKKW